MLRRFLSALGIGRRVDPEHVAWLDDTLLLVAYRTSGRGTPQPLEGRAEFDGRALEVAVHASPQARRSEPRHGWQLLVLELPAEAAANLGDTQLVVRCGHRRLRLDAATLTAAPRDAIAIAESLTEAAPAEKARLLDFLLETYRERLATIGGATLGTNMRILRDALRLRLHVQTVSGEEAMAVNVDRVLAVDERSFWIKGWVSDPKGSVTSITAVSPEGSRADMLEGAFRHERRDVQQLYVSGGQDTGEKHGLMKYFQLDAPSKVAGGWIAELHSATGGSVEAEAPVAIRDTLTVRDSILGDTMADTLRRYELTELHAYPALTRLQERLAKTLRVETVVQHGTPPSSPDVSVIIPLYGRIDFVQHQFAQFAHDRELQGCDLIYVLDDPQLAEGLHRHASELHEFYGFPFRVVVLNRHAGFPGANNLAVSVARGRIVVLVNSDVFPDRPGWVGTMAAFYDATPGVGALGPKLLYEDGSLQHAGLMFQREAETGLWGNQHYYKGFNSDFPPANVARPVPAVTGGCMMIDRELYEELGGLSDGYIQGGHEDSDLCLRLIGTGRSNWYLPQVQLYHLEDQSYPPEQRKLVTRYNTWLQTHLWGDRIEELMRSQGAPDETVAAEPAETT